MLILPYQGETGITLINKLKKDLQHKLPNNVETHIVFTGKKLSTMFQCKDKVIFGNQHNIVYKATCAEPGCNDTYVGECERRINERIKDHSGRDHSSHLVTHSIENAKRLLLMTSK